MMKNDFKSLIDDLRRHKEEQYQSWTEIRTEIRTEIAEMKDMLQKFIRLRQPHPPLNPSPSQNSHVPGSNSVIQQSKEISCPSLDLASQLVKAEFPVEVVDVDSPSDLQVKDDVSPISHSTSDISVYAKPNPLTNPSSLEGLAEVHCTKSQVPILKSDVEYISVNEDCAENRIIVPYDALDTAVNICVPSVCENVSTTLSSHVEITVLEVCSVNNVSLSLAWLDKPPPFPHEPPDEYLCLEVASDASVVDQALDATGLKTKRHNDDLQLVPQVDCGFLKLVDSCNFSPFLLSIDDTFGKAAGLSSHDYFRFEGVWKNVYEKPNFYFPPTKPPDIIRYLITSSDSSTESISLILHHVHSPDVLKTEEHTHFGLTYMAHQFSHFWACSLNLISTGVLSLALSRESKKFSYDLRHAGVIMLEFDNHSKVIALVPGAMEFGHGLKLSNHVVCKGTSIVTSVAQPRRDNTNGLSMACRCLAISKSCVVKDYSDVPAQIFSDDFLMTVLYEDKVNRDFTESAVIGSSVFGNEILVVSSIQMDEKLDQQYGKPIGEQWRILWYGEVFQVLFHMLRAIVGADIISLSSISTDVELVPNWLGKSAHVPPDTNKLTASSQDISTTASVYNVILKTSAEIVVAKVLRNGKQDYYITRNTILIWLQMTYVYSALFKLVKCQARSEMRVNALVFHLEYVCPFTTLARPLITLFTIPFARGEKQVSQATSSQWGVCDLITSSDSHVILAKLVGVSVVKNPAAANVLRIVSPTISFRKSRLLINAIPVGVASYSYNIFIISYMASDFKKERKHSFDLFNCGTLAAALLFCKTYEVVFAYTVVKELFLIRMEWVGAQVSAKSYYVAGIIHFCLFKYELYPKSLTIEVSVSIIGEHFGDQKWCECIMIYDLGVRKREQSLFTMFWSKIMQPEFDLGDEHHFLLITDYLFTMPGFQSQHPNAFISTTVINHHVKMQVLLMIKVDKVGDSENIVVGFKVSLVKEVDLAWLTEPEDEGCYDITSSDCATKHEILWFSLPRPPDIANLEDTHETSKQIRLHGSSTMIF